MEIEILTHKRGNAKIQETHLDDFVERSGVYQSPYGTVECASYESDNGKDHYTYCQMFVRGSSYTHCVGRSYSVLGLTRLAAKFAREVAKIGGLDLH